MTEQTKTINPWLKQVLELGPPIAFFVIYLRLRDQSFTLGGTDYSGFIVATIAFIPILLAAMGILAGFRLAYFACLVIILAGLVTEHWLAKRRSLKWINIAFFRLNALVSVIFLVGVLAEVILSVEPVN